MMDEKLVQALLQTETSEEFFERYTQYTGRDTVVMGEFEEDERVWKHLRKLLHEYKSPNLCTTPEGWEIYIPFELPGAFKTKKDEE